MAASRLAVYNHHHKALGQKFPLKTLLGAAVGLEISDFATMGIALMTPNSTDETPCI